MDEFQGQGFIVAGNVNPFVRSVVLLAAEMGASVVFTMPEGSEREGQSLLVEAEARGVAERVCGIPGNVASEEEIEQFMDEAVERLPGFHVLIHDLSNSRSRQESRLLDMGLEEWNRALDRQLRVPFLVARRAIQEFLADGQGGQLVYVVPDLDKSGAGGAALAASKTALYALIRSIAKEYGRRNIRCNAISLDRADQSGGANSTGRGVPSHKNGNYQDLAELTLFLASNEAAYMNGAVVPAACTVDAFIDLQSNQS